MDRVKNILSDLAAVEVEIRALGEVLEGVEHHMGKLEEAGLEYGTTFYRDKKYFYINRCGQGRRERHYVGTDPEKIEGVLAAKERAKKYEELKEKYSSLGQRLNEISRNLSFIQSSIHIARRVVCLTDWLCHDKAEVQKVSIPPGGGLQLRLDGGADIVDAQCRVVGGKGEGKALPDNLRRELLKKQIKKELAAKGIQEPFLTAQAVCRLKSEHGL